MPSKKVRARECKAAVAGAPMQTDETMISAIRDKWHEQTKATGGYFLRFLDGDTGNCRLDNLDYCHPHDAFTNADWKVDWDMELTPAESAFVRANLSTFATIYEAQAGKPRPKKKAAPPPADWAPWDKTNAVSFSLHTTPWDEGAGVDIDTLDVAGGSLVDLLYANHKNVTSLFMLLMQKRGMSLTVQQGLLKTEYFDSVGELPHGLPVRCPVAFIVATGYLEQLLVAAQQSMYLAGKQDYDSADDKFFQLYYDSGGTVNIRVGFQFNGKRVQMSIIETASEKYIAVYAKD